MKYLENLNLHVFGLLCSNCILNNCGTTLSDQEDMQLPGLSSDVSADRDGSDAMALPSETDGFDLSDTPTEGSDSLADTASFEEQPNGSGQDLDTGPPLDGSDGSVACNANIECINVTGRVIDADGLGSAVPFGMLVTCEVSGTNEVALDASLWQYGGQTESAFFVSGQRRIQFVPGLPEPQLIRVRTACGATAETTLNVAPPTHETLIVGSWSASLPETTWDADLYVRRDAGDCWNNPAAVMVAWSPEQRLDWGIQGRDSDDPHAGPDARWLPAYESVRCDAPNPSETWEISLRMPLERPSETLSVRLRIWASGELVADELRALNPAFAGKRWWSVGFFNPLIGWSPVEQILADRPMCDSICGGGGSAWPEACNGVDDDCNGTVDDGACTTGICAYIPTLDRFQCVAP